MPTFTPQPVIQNRRALGQALMSRGLNPQASASNLAPFAALAQGFTGGFLNSSANRLEQGNQDVRQQTLDSLVGLDRSEIGRALIKSGIPEFQDKGLGAILKTTAGKKRFETDDFGNILDTFTGEVTGDVFSGRQSAAPPSPATTTPAQPSSQPPRVAQTAPPTQAPRLPAIANTAAPPPEGAELGEVAPRGEKPQINFPGFRPIRNVPGLRGSRQVQADLNKGPFPNRRIDPSSPSYSGFLNKVLSPLQKQRDKEFAKDMSIWADQGGIADTRKQMSQLRKVLGMLTSGRTVNGIKFSGPKQKLTGLVEGGASRFIPGSKQQTTKELVQEVVQRNLRTILGAQFTEKEGTALIKRAFNEFATEEENAERVGRLLEQMTIAAQQKTAAIEYVRKWKTLDGFTGVIPTFGDFEKLFESDAEQRFNAQPQSAPQASAGSVRAGTTINSLDEAAASLREGQTVTDPRTGQRFKKQGGQMVPFTLPQSAAGLGLQ